MFYQVPIRRGALHRLQAVWSHLPCSGTVHTGIPVALHTRMTWSVDNGLIDIWRSYIFIVQHRHNFFPLSLHLCHQIRACLVCPGHLDWSRNSGWWQQEDDPLRYWHDQMYLLRILSGGVSCGRHRRGVCVCAHFMSQDYWQKNCSKLFLMLIDLIIFMIHQSGLC